MDPEEIDTPRKRLSRRKQPLSEEEQLIEDAASQLISILNMHKKYLNTIQKAPIKTGMEKVGMPLDDALRSATEFYIATGRQLVEKGGRETDESRRS